MEEIKDPRAGLEEVKQGQTQNQQSLESGNESLSFLISDSSEDQLEKDLKQHAKMFVNMCHRNGKAHVTYEKAMELLSKLYEDQ